MTVTKADRTQQHTLAAPLWFAGVGLHSGQRVAMRVLPAPDEHGIVFKRMGRGGHISASWENVVDTSLCTVLGDGHGQRISTVEHLMAAFRAMSIDNATVELSRDEVPILDGSSASFIEAFAATGLVRQKAPRRYLRVLKTIEVRDGDRWARLEPCSRQIHTATIDFDHPMIGRQSFSIDVDAGEFDKVAFARTFGLERDVEHMQSVGLALGGSLSNAILLGDAAVINDSGLHSKDEFVRHKLLDSVGDLYLAGGPIKGRFVSHKAGHALHCQLLNELFSDPMAHSFVSASERKVATPVSTRLLAQVRATARQLMERRS
ncbi:MAG: UDP-3-O-acyl-N-acetylglucosamine deacetylase [Lysobacteraceae bacterium]|nr:MAG: UDP-3-O-acyl-N-acetylglucosamine deacetylase [Xanthomonadaceae bacterium]